MTTTQLNNFVGVERDRWGRYLIPDPTTGKKRAWTRATTVASTLSDKFGLQQWAQRMTARGLVLRPDLFALAAACDPDDKKKLNGLVEDAKEAAAASSGANLGTALHSFTEQLDRGEQVHAPAPWCDDLDAYQHALIRAGITIDPAYVENIVTLPALGVAGTFDRLVNLNHTLTVADLKTGSFLDWNEISIQLALYAHAETIYDPATNIHTPMPKVDQKRALVIHLPAGQARCELWLVDIEQGWEGVQQAMWTREWRNRKNLAARHEPRCSTTPRASLLEHQAVWLRGRIERIVSALNGAPLPTPWPTHIPTFRNGGPTSLEQCDALGDWCWTVEGELQLPFPTVAPHELALGEVIGDMTSDEVNALIDAVGVKPFQGTRAFTAADVARILEHNSNTPTTNTKEKETNHQ